MRQIKFKAWNGKFIDDDLFMPKGWLNQEIRAKEKKFKFKLMQFTGLKDKNKKEIYEGDIVKFGSLDNTGIIKFFEGRFIIEEQRFYHEKKLYVYNKKDPDTFIEVIGNIFQDKKLLKEKK